jgi:polyisoprenoid-binding protein YceI
MSTHYATETAISTWNIDPAHSAAEFAVRHMMISSVKGHFARVTGTLTYDEIDLAHSTVVASIEAASIETRDPQRDTHLRSADFLDVEHFPQLTFRSTRIGPIRAGEFEMIGDLTIRGVTLPVRFTAQGPSLPTKDPWGNLRIAVSATTQINRKEFGLTWNATLEAGGILVSDEVTITLDVELVKA